MRATRRCSQNRAMLSPLPRCSSMIRDHFSRADSVLLMHEIFHATQHDARCRSFTVHQILDAANLYRVINMPSNRNAAGTK